MKLGSLRISAAAIWMGFALGILAAQQPAGTGLKNLELSADLSPVIQFDPVFSSAIYDYSVMVDSTNVRSIRINPTPVSNNDAVTINGNPIEPGNPYKADLKSGENKFDIGVASPAGTPVQYRLSIIRKDLSGQYKTELVQKGIWRITDYFGFPPNQDMYLIEGGNKAILIDAGMGKGDLAGLVKSLTALPVEIAITHGHGDHLGQVSQFAGSVVYMSEKDRGMIPKTLDTAKFKWVKDGDRIVMGAGRALEVIDVPGHSAGSIMFLDGAGKTLAIGDAIGSGMYVWKFIPGTPSLAEYRDTLKKLEARLAGFDSLTFLTGHHWQEKTPLVGTTGKQMIADMRILSEKIISGEIAGTSASSNLGGRKMNIRTAEYGLAGIWYDPDNIQPAK